MSIICPKCEAINPPIKVCGETHFIEMCKNVVGKKSIFFGLKTIDKHCNFIGAFDEDDYWIQIENKQLQNMTLTTKNDNQPDWVKPELGLEESNGFKLGQKVKHYDDVLYIIHIQNVENETLCRCMLPNQASITLNINQLNTF